MLLLLFKKITQMYFELFIRITNPFFYLLTNYGDAWWGYVLLYINKNSPVRWYRNGFKRVTKSFVYCALHVVVQVPKNFKIKMS